MIYILQDSLNNITINAYHDNLDQVLCDMINLTIKFNRHFIVKVLSDKNKLRKSGIINNSYYILQKRHKTYKIYFIYKGKFIKVCIENFPETQIKMNNLINLCATTKKNLIKTYKKSNINHIESSVFMSKKEYIRRLFLFSEPKIEFEEKNEFISLEST